MASPARLACWWERRPNLPLADTLLPGPGPWPAPPPPAGAAFPKSYTQDLKKAMIDSGKVQPTGCPEYIFY